MQIRRALISVYSKEGVVDLARRLQALNVEIVSSGGTARLLRDEGMQVRSVDEMTGHPEMLDGRVKTLHPKIHAGILARRDDPSHQAQLAEHGIEPIDLVVVNFYPFRRTVESGVERSDAIEMIDIGGPSMVRSAAKNHDHVAVVIDPGDYEALLEELESSGSLIEATRRRLAARAFQATAEYDTAILDYLSGDAKAEDGPPKWLHVNLERTATLRYGENPHQPAAFYAEPGAERATLAGAETLQGKQLSFNNLLDLDAALALVREFTEPTAVVVKHTNPCGTALGATMAEAFRRAVETDPVSAFGGIVAMNRAVDRDAAEAMLEGFLECAVAPDYTAEARERLARKKNLRLLRLDLKGAPGHGGWDVRRIRGGFLVQSWDDGSPGTTSRVVTRRAPTPAEERALGFAWAVAKHVKSNAIVFTGEDRTLGIGAGQMSRVDSVRLARQKANASLEGSVLASDAFFPFRDGVDAAAEAGATAVIQPGGSIRDDEVIAAADEHDLAMVFTGIRHFKH